MFLLDMGFLCDFFFFQILSLYIFAKMQAVIEAGVIAPLVHLLQTVEFDIKKEAAWAISNATSGGTHEQIKYGILIPVKSLIFA